MMTKTSTNKCRKVKHLKMYWLMFSSCSYPGPPGPGPGIPGCHVEDEIDNFNANNSNELSDNVVMSQNLVEENTSQKRCVSRSRTSKNIHTTDSYQHLKTINNITNKYNKNSNRRRSLLDSNLLWIFLGFIWLSSPTLVGCRNDEPILVSSCDFSRLERSLNRVASRKTVQDDANRITTNSNSNNCTYVKLNYYDYVNDSSSKINNYNNYSDLQLLSPTFSSSSSSSFSSTNSNTNSASELYPATIDNNNNNDDFISDKEKKQSEIDRKIIDEFRLEAIKAQILSKLGLKSKPHVTHTVSRDIVLETIQRAKETYFNYDNNNMNNYHRNAYDLYYISGDNSANGANNNNYNQNYDNSNNNNNKNGEFDYKMTNDYYERQQYANYNQHQPVYDTMYESAQQQQRQQQFPPDFDQVENEPDDFYAKTSEIISFAGKGEYLLNFVLVL